MGGVTQMLPILVPTGPAKLSRCVSAPERMAAPCTCICNDSHLCPDSPAECQFMTQLSYIVTGNVKDVQLRSEQP
jgi:hypothetical protein